MKPAICFAAGTMGHFVLHVVCNILYDTEIIIEPCGSCHYKLHLPKNIFVADCFDLSDTTESWQQENDYINSLNTDTILVGHMRNVELLVKRGFLPIYITFDVSSSEHLYKETIRKTSTNFSREAYDIVSGPDWPLYGEPLPEWVLEEIKEKWISVYKDWRWILPVTGALELKYEELLNTDWPLKLFKFFHITPTHTKIDYITTKIKQYTKLQNIL